MQLFSLQFSHSHTACRSWHDDVLGDQQIVTLSDAENKRHSNSPLLQSITNPEQDSSVTSSILRSTPKSNTEYASCHSIAGHA